jgi:protein-L-isoaspartate(D-aspartate) O-methyltransferase
MPTAETHAVNSPHGPADAATQRLNMVESQVRPSDVTDRRILRAMGAIPREAFVPAHLAAVAYMDDVISLSKGADGRRMLSPRTLAKMIQELRLEANAAVLDVGCTTGYAAAVIASLARRVVGVEVDAALAAEAVKALATKGVANAAIYTGALPAGRPDDGPYDAILIEGAITGTPLTLLDQLKDGGRLVAIQQSGAVGKATVWTRAGRVFDARDAFDAGAAVLPGFERAKTFTF